MSNKTLILEVIAHPDEPVGYAEVFRCTVSRVIAGDIPDAEFFLTVLAGDAERSRFFALHPPPAVVELGFDKTGQDAPYATMPITGFVDSSKSVWMLQGIAS